MALIARQAWTDQADTAAAFDEVVTKVEAHAANICLLFVSPRHDLEALGPLIAQRITCPVMACTTAGELVAGRGYVEHGLAALSLRAEDLNARVFYIDDVRRFGSAEAQALAMAILLKLGPWSNATTFGMLLVDGLSMCEEAIISGLSGAMDGMPIVGGSAGTHAAHQNTFIYHDGRFHCNAATLMVVHTRHPFRVFQTQNFVPMERRLVVTAADAQRRIVREIDGMPAVDAYADAIDMRPEQITPAVMSRWPLMIKVGQLHYVRGIWKVDADGSLSTYSAIDTGLVVRVGQLVDMVGNLREQVDRLTAELPNLAATVAFDCINRRLIVADDNLGEAMAHELTRAKALGFSTFGEQVQGLHVNQTLTGVALGSLHAD